jgi:hypothetical protein
VVSPEREAARREEAGRGATGEEVVAGATVAPPGRTLLLARLYGVDVDDDVHDRIIRRAERRRREDENFRALLAVWPDRVREVPRSREVRARRAAERSSVDDDSPGLRRLDIARLLKADPGPPPVYACRCRPGEDCFGCGTRRRDGAS